MVDIGGKKVKGTTLALAGAGLGAAFLFYRHFASGSSSSTGSSSSSSSIDPVTGLPYSEDSTVDPATGMTYLAEAQQYGSVAAAEAAVQGNYSAAGGYSGLGYVGTSGYPSTSNVTGGTAPAGYSSNAQWAQAVQAGLVALGYASTDVAAALGLFFAGHPLPANYASLIQTAEAEYGPPPQGTYQIIPEPSTGGAGGGGTGTGSGSGGGTVTVPHVTGETQQAAQDAIRSAGLQVRTLLTGGPGAAGHVTWQRPSGGQQAAQGSIVDIHVKK